MGKSISIEAEVNLGEIDIDDLIDELKSRHNELKRRNDKKSSEYLKKIEDIHILFENPKKLLDHFKKCLGLREFHSKEDIIKTIQEL